MPPTSAGLTGSDEDDGRIGLRRQQLERKSCALQGRLEVIRTCAGVAGLSSCSVLLGNEVLGSPKHRGDARLQLQRGCEKRRMDGCGATVRTAASRSGSVDAVRRKPCRRGSTAPSAPPCATTETKIRGDEATEDGVVRSLRDRRVQSGWHRAASKALRAGHSCASGPPGQAGSEWNKSALARENR